MCSTNQRETTRWRATGLHDRYFIRCRERLFRSTIGLAGIFIASCANTFPTVSSSASDAIISVSEQADEWCEAWSVEDDFESPESAVIAHQFNSIFVSNVNGYSRNGNGFISRLSIDGNVLDLKWLTGLNAPTGLAVHNKILWAVDFDRLVKIDISAGKIIASYPVNDVDPLLNDVAVTESGEVFVTGSASKTIYHLSDGRLSKWLTHEVFLRDANGITASDESIVVAGYSLVRIFQSDKTIEPLPAPESLVDLEGVKFSAKDDLLVSAIGGRPLVQLFSDGSIAPLFSGESYIADFDTDGTMIVAPVSMSKVAGFIKIACSLCLKDWKAPNR